MPRGVAARTAATPARTATATEAASIAHPDDLLMSP
jgi:hypothetical protein